MTQETGVGLIYTQPKYSHAMQRQSINRIANEFDVKIINWVYPARLMWPEIILQYALGHQGISCVITMTEKALGDTDQEINKTYYGADHKEVAILVANYDD